MFQKGNKNLEEIFFLAKALKQKFPQVKFKIKTKNNYYEIYAFSLIDRYQFEELKQLLENKIRKKIKLILQNF